jgi:hypothetical protein
LPPERAVFLSPGFLRSLQLLARGQQP